MVRSTQASVLAFRGLGNRGQRNSARIEQAVPPERRSLASGDFPHPFPEHGSQGMRSGAFRKGGMSMGFSVKRRFVLDEIRATVRMKRVWDRVRILRD